MNRFKALLLGIALSFGTSAGAIKCCNLSLRLFHVGGYTVTDGEVTTSGNNITTLTGSLSGNGLVNEAISLFTYPSPYYYPGGGVHPSYATFDNLFFPTQPFVYEVGVAFSARGYLFIVYSKPDTHWPIAVLSNIFLNQTKRHFYLCR